MNNKNSSWGLMNFVAFIILAALLVVGGSLLGTYSSSKQTTGQVAGEESQFQTTVIKTVAVDGQDGKTVLDLLKANHEVQTSQSTFGVFVESIDTDKNTSDTYWMFYADEQLIPSSVDSYQTKTGQKIEARYEKFE